jgi:hypothetical protein
MRIPTASGARWLCALALFCTFGTARAANVFSYVEFVEGRASVVDAKGQSRPARVGGTVLEGETLVTGSDGEIHARTDDHGLVALRANTRIKIESYRAAGDDQDKSVLSLIGGTLRSISGWIGKYRPASYAIKANTATVGIRGTDHEPLVIAPGDKQALAGTYDKVNEGSTYIQNAAGRTDITSGHAGFAPHDGNTAPRVLDKIPDAYHATRNEARIDQRKEQLAREMEQRRLARQKEIKEKAEATSQKLEEKSDAAKDKAVDKSDVSKENTEDKSDVPKADEKSDAKEKARERRRRALPKS